MSRLVESIRISQGKFWNLDLHEARANLSRKTLFGISEPINLRASLADKIPAGRATCKCRVLYGESVEEISITPYRIRSVHSAMAVICDDIDYSFKYEERPALDKLFALREMCSEIIIIKNGLVTDAYYYNLLFEKSGRLFTPATPLLAGVQRQKMLSESSVQATDIKAEDMAKYDRVHFINALTLPGKAVISARDIITKHLK